MKYFQYQGTDLTFIDEIDYTHIHAGMGSMEVFFEHFKDLPENIFHSPILDSAEVCRNIHNCLPVTSYSLVFYKGLKIVAQANKTTK